MKRKDDTIKQSSDITKPPILTRIRDFIENVIYICILVPLVFSTLHIVWQSITQPDKIPDIFGWKIFMILDEYMDDRVESGDLVFVKNVKVDELKTNDIIAFRNAGNGVTLHEIIKIDEDEITDEESKENRILKTFTMKTQTNETNDTTYVTEEKVEGLLVHRVPKLGSILYFIQQPLAMLGISGVILIIGLICINIAGRLDEKDRKKELEVEISHKL